MFFALQIKEKVYNICVINIVMKRRSPTSHLTDVVGR